MVDHTVHHCYDIDTRSTYRSQLDVCGGEVHTLAHHALDLYGLPIGRMQSTVYERYTTILLLLTCRGRHTVYLVVVLVVMVLRGNHQLLANY